jgi:hypothetical protein
MVILAWEVTMILAIYYQQPMIQTLQIENFEKFFKEANDYLDKNNVKGQFIENPDVAFDIGLASFIDDFAFTRNRALTERIMRKGVWSFDAIKFLYIDLLFSKLKNKKINLNDKIKKAKEYQEGILKIPRSL